MGNYLIIRIDHPIIERLKLLWEARLVLATSGGFFDDDLVGFVRRTPQWDGNGDLISIDYTLDGGKPFYLVDYKVLMLNGIGVENIGGKIIQLGTIRLKVIDRSYYSYYSWDCLTMIPDEWSVLFYYLSPVYRFIDLIYRRLILTAAVWGLARCRTDEIPHWGHMIWNRKDKE